MLPGREERSGRTGLLWEHNMMGREASSMPGPDAGACEHPGQTRAVEKRRVTR